MKRRPSSAEFFGEEAARRWHEVFDAIRAFAKADGCPLGADMVEWFRERTAAFGDRPARPVN